MTETWWLSFVDPERAPGSRFLGVAILDMPSGSTIVDAVKQAWKDDLNPGGEVISTVLPADRIAKEYRGRLLSKEEAERLAKLAFTNA